MTDLVLFASLFAVYAVFRAGVDTAGLFDPSTVLAETLILLTSSFTAACALLAAAKGSRLGTVLALTVTALLGTAFLKIELGEFAKMIANGQGPQTSGFFSSYFTLVGTHGLHIALGLIWMVALTVKIAFHGFSEGKLRKLALLSFFWHFLDIVWIFIFTIVYLFGML